MTKATFSKSFLNIFPFLSALMVIGIHSYGISSSESSVFATRVEGFLCHGLFTAAVPVFFIMSGYLFFRNTETVSDVFVKQKKRIRTLLIPFLAWSASYFLFNAIICRLPFIPTNGFVELSPISILRGVLLFEYCFPLWYLFQLIIYTALTPLVFYLLKKRYVVAVLIVALFTLSFFGIKSINVIFGTLDRDIFHLNYLAYWLFGCLLARSPLLGSIKEKVKKWPIVPIIIATLVVAYCSSLCFDDVWNIGNNRIFVPLVTLGWFLFLIRCFDGKEMGEFSRFCGFIPAIIMYGVHSLVGQILWKVFTILQFSPPTLVNFFLGFFIVSLLSIGIALVIKKWMKPLYIIYAGNR